MSNITKEEKIKGTFFGAIVADALCLGSHYEYDAKKIHQAYGEKPIEKFMSPGEMMGGQTQHMPLKVNYAGVMPIIFAQAIIMFPAQILGFLFPANETATAAIGWAAPQIRIG